MVSESVNFAEKLSLGAQFFLQRCCLEWTTTLRHYKLSYIFSRSTGPVEHIGTVGICPYQLLLQKSILLSGLIFTLIVLKLLVSFNFKTVPLGLKNNVLIGQFDNFMRKAFRDNQVEKSWIYNKVEKEAICTGYRDFHLNPIIPGEGAMAWTPFWYDFPRDAPTN